MLPRRSIAVQLLITLLAKCGGTTGLALGPVGQTARQEGAQLLGALGRSGGRFLLTRCRGAAPLIYQYGDKVIILTKETGS